MPSWTSDGSNDKSMSNSANWWIGLDMMVCDPSQKTAVADTDGPKCSTGGERWTNGATQSAGSNPDCAGETWVVGDASTAPGI